MFGNAALRELQASTPELGGSGAGTGELALLLKEITAAKLLNSSTYRKTFFAAHPELEGYVRVHHEIEQQVLKRYPGMFTEQELNSLPLLAGIPNADNDVLHLSILRKEWDAFYFAHPPGTATRQDLFNKMLELRNKYGDRFAPIKQ